MLCSNKLHSIYFFKIIENTVIFKVYSEKDNCHGNSIYFFKKIV